MTNATGIVQQESTYYPFGGEQRVITNTVENRCKFTGLERDAEGNQLDHTLFRKYASNLACWLTPDPDNAGAFENIDDPQAWNGYAYVPNYPVNLTDPSGEDWEVCQVDEHGKKHNCAVLTNKQYDAWVEANKNTLTFAGEKIFYKGRRIGTAQEIPILDPARAAALHYAGEVGLQGVKSGATMVAGNVVGGLAGAGLGLVAGRLLPELADLGLSGSRAYKVVVNVVHAARPGHLSIGIGRASEAVESAVQ
jgi:RHS repeat-associated protein